MSPNHVRNVTELACRNALSRRGVAHVSMPVDLQSEPVRESEASKRNVPGHNVSLWSRGARLPDQQAIEDAAQLLNDGSKTVILAGRGAIGAGEQLESIAETLGAVIAKPLLGKSSVPDDSPYTTGSVGLLGTLPSQQALEDCDTLLIAGSSFPYIEFYPAPGQARCVQIDIDATRIGLRYPAEVGLVGDVATTLDALQPLLRRNEDRSFLEKAQQGMQQWNELMETRGTLPDTPMKPQVVAWELGKRLADDAVFTCDSGTIATWYARQIPVRRDQQCTLSGNLATMANGFPYAMAAQVAWPERQCVAFVGDGGFTMLMGELATCVKQSRSW
jgi:pyruvate dehydrogenase (quinone)/pyruvate oxidase